MEPDKTYCSLGNVVDLLRDSNVTDIELSKGLSVLLETHSSGFFVDELKSLGEFMDEIRRHDGLDSKVKKSTVLSMFKIFLSCDFLFNGISEKMRIPDALKQIISSGLKFLLFKENNRMERNTTIQFLTNMMKKYHRLRHVFLSKEVVRNLYNVMKERKENEIKKKDNVDNEVDEDVIVFCLSLIRKCSLLRECAEEINGMENGKFYELLVDLVESRGCSICVNIVIDIIWNLFDFGLDFGEKEIEETIEKLFSIARSSRKRYFATPGIKNRTLSPLETKKSKSKIEDEKKKKRKFEKDVSFTLRGKMDVSESSLQSLEDKDLQHHIYCLLILMIIRMKKKMINDKERGDKAVLRICEKLGVIKELMSNIDNVDRNAGVVIASCSILFHYANMIFDITDENERDDELKMISEKYNIIPKISKFINLENQEKKYMRRLYREETRELWIIVLSIIQKFVEIERLEKDVLKYVEKEDEQETFRKKNALSIVSNYTEMIFNFFLVLDDKKLEEKSLTLLCELSKYESGSRILSTKTDCLKHMCMLAFTKYNLRVQAKSLDCKIKAIEILANLCHYDYANSEKFSRNVPISNLFEMMSNNCTKSCSLCINCIEVAKSLLKNNKNNLISFLSSEDSIREMITLLMNNKKAGAQENFSMVQYSTLGFFLSLLEIDSNSFSNEGLDDEIKDKVRETLSNEKEFILRLINLYKETKRIKEANEMIIKMKGKENQTENNIQVDFRTRIFLILKKMNSFAFLEEINNNNEKEKEKEKENVQEKDEEDNDDDNDNNNNIINTPTKNQNLFHYFLPTSDFGIFLNLKDYQKKQQLKVWRSIKNDLQRENIIPLEYDQNKLDEKNNELEKLKKQSSDRKNLYNEKQMRLNKEEEKKFWQNFLLKIKNKKEEKEKLNNKTPLKNGLNRGGDKKKIKKLSDADRRKISKKIFVLYLFFKDSLIINL